MKCVICKHGETTDGTTTITLERDSSTIVFKDVPALVCDNCGEKYVDGKTTKKLLQKANELVKNGTEVDIRKFQDAAQLSFSIGYENIQKDIGIEKYLTHIWKLLSVDVNRQDDPLHQRVQ